VSFFYDFQKRNVRGNTPTAFCPVYGDDFKLNMVVYVKPGCFWCSDAISWLQSRGIAHTAVDVFADRSAFDRMKQISGQTKAPTLEMPDGEVLADFDVAELERFLKARESR
jgi:glutaredoxin